MSESIKVIDFPLNLTIMGDGSSLWVGIRSQGEWKITKGSLRGCALNEPAYYPGGIWELQLFGPETMRGHYSDNQIEKEVDRQLRLLASEMIGWSVKEIMWSELGMQPDRGWSFDVMLDEGGYK